MQETIWFAALALVFGFALIIKCGDVFVDGTVYFAEITRIPKLLIGATVISVCTTLPELMVSSIAVTSGTPDMGIGNALGSIICNTALILGISATALPAHVHKSTFRAKASFLLAAIALLFVFMLDKNISAFEGVLLGIIMILFFVYSITAAKRARKYNEHEETPEVNRKLIITNSLKFAIGVAGIIWGSKILVKNAKFIAHALGVSNQIIGLTVVALGTSLPELVTTISAIVKKEFSLSVGNVIGANILNIVMILSTCSIISPSGLQVSMQSLPFFNGQVPQSLVLDVPVILFLSLLVIVPAWIKGKLYRWQGITLLTLYAGYIGYLAIGRF
jgi:cation:H+ antiporter